MEMFDFHETSQTIPAHRQQNTESPPPAMVELRDGQPVTPIQEKQQLPKQRPRIIGRSKTENEIQQSPSPKAPSMKRRKSLFSIFHRKSPIDSIIDMYFDDVQIVEENSPKKKGSKLDRSATTKG